MQNTVLFNAATTLAVDQGKLFVNNRSGSDLTSPEAQRFIPMDITGIFGVTKQAGAAGASRTQTATVGTPVVGQLFKLTFQVFKESDWGFFGPQLVTFDVQFTATTTTAADVAAGLTAAINLVGPYFGVTATVATAVITITSNTAVPQNINVTSTGVGTITMAQTVAFTKPYGLAAFLLLTGLTNAVAGQVYTQYVFKVKQGNVAGHVNTGTDYLEQTVYTNNATLVTAIDAFIAAPLASPATYNL
jgi:hypothetical protein